MYRNVCRVVVFAFGSGEHGQLGNGRTGEHIVSAGKTAFDVESEPSELLVAYRLYYV